MARIHTILLAVALVTTNHAKSQEQAPASTNSNSQTIKWPGRQPDGSVLLPNSWSLRPAGKQIALGVFPVNMAVHPGGRFAAVLHSGYAKHEVVIVDIPAAKIVSRMPVSESFYGLQFSADGKELFCSGAGDEVIHRFRFDNGKLTGQPEIRLHAKSETDVPAGLAVARDGEIFVANVFGHRITRVSPKDLKHPVDIPLSAGTNRIDMLYPTDPEETYPYGCVLDDKRQKLYVSLWAQAQIAVIDLRSNQIVEHWTTEEHPCEMALTRSGKILFVANASRNTVTVFDTTTGRAIETLWAALYPQSPPGSTPNSLALSPGEDLLFIANANINAVAVFDVSKPGTSRSLGFIPTDWYPTSVRMTPDGRRLLIANGKGASSMADPKPPGGSFALGRFPGTLSIVDVPKREEFLRQLTGWTAEVLRNSPLRPDASVSASRSRDNPVPVRPGEPGPIRYCIYIIKENRTYDQVLGDMPRGNGDAKLCLFPERITPNHHKLAREFVLLDNFYVESEVSMNGHEWSMAAYATDFIEKMWPLSYGHNKRSGKFPYMDGSEVPIAAPAGGYLWDRARADGVSYRSYGEFVHNGSTLNDPAHTKVKALQGHFDPGFHGWDLDYPDVKRADRFIGELKKFETEGDMPRLQILRLPNDHTHGAAQGKRTPAAYLGDNDLALGRVVEAVSRSKFWAQTAIFVVEDDAQNGPDHVDAHRTVAFVISPYTRRGAVDSTLYSTSSMLRTMELILGMKPMTQFDAAATPMFNSFEAAPDLRPYEALPANVDLTEKNGPLAWGGNIRMNFAKEDMADDLLLNEIVWRSVRGADNPMPAPVHASFVFVRAGKDDD